MANEQHARRERSSRPKGRRPRQAAQEAPRPTREPLDLVLAALLRHKEAIAHVERMPPRRAQHAPRDPPMPVELRAALGPDFRFYAHQARAIQAAAQGRHVVVATGTSSGKSQCYNVPVLARILADPRAKALYLFPTRALAQDQLRALRALAARAGRDVEAVTYDSDTPDHERRAIRNGRSASIVFTTPDMLHQGLLPWHHQWRWFFERLAFVVVDEVHTYRGIFGSHVANVFRRLGRVAATYGAAPTFVACSATIANPGDFAQRLCGVPFEVVDRDGSPQGARTVLFWNPPVVRHDHDGEGVRDKAFVHSARVFVEHVKRGVRAIDFTRSRKLTERVYRGAHRLLDREASPLRSRISPYRAGYTAQERRDIERRLFDGTLLGVVATSALELGVDVGAMDAAIVTGFPGTTASFWQQAGRAGRSGRRALITFVADDDALNQYWMAHPEAFFQRPHERAIVNPDNPYVLDAHLACAVREVPMPEDEATRWGPAAAEALARLERGGLVRREGGRWWWRGDHSPAHRLGIRSATSGAFAVVDRRGQPVGERMEEARVYRDLHPGAVHMHLGETYVVDDLDLEARRVVLAEADVDHRTEPLSTTEVDVLKVERRRKAGRLEVRYGSLKVTQRVTGFVRVDERGDALDQEELTLPETTLVTKGLWYDLPTDAASQLVAQGHDVAGAIHAAEHAMIALTPLLAMCDRWDLGGVSHAAHPGTGRPTVFLYDAHPGGVGITEADFEHFPDIAAMTLRLLRDCPCKEGCPACVQSPKCGNRNKPLDKAGARAVLELLQPEEGKRARGRRAR